jgi:hypothetical protein
MSVVTLVLYNYIVSAEAPILAAIKSRHFFLGAIWPLGVFGVRSSPLIPWLHSTTTPFSASFLFSSTYFLPSYNTSHSFY